MTNTNNEQLELGFNGLRRGSGPAETRIPRAGWWFNRMRNIVADAIDWNAANEPRPEQIWMPGATREVKV